MNLRGIDFGHVLDGSGARGWFREGHIFHPLVPGLDFTDSTFVAKTTTLEKNRGNANVRRDGLTFRVFPQRAIKVYWRHGAVVNAFGLTGPGFQALLDTGRWQRLTEPFFLSFMAIEESPKDRLEEVRAFVRMLKRELPKFLAPGVGLQVNFSCPNVHANDLYDLPVHLNEYKELGIPVMVKLSAIHPVELALEIAKLSGCDALCISNSIAWGELPDKIDWSKFGTESPLPKRGCNGPGGLSGQPLLPIVVDWVRRAVSLGLKKPINAGGGILHPKDIDLLVDAGADSVFIGSIAILRPWRVRATIEHANKIFSERAAHDIQTVPARRRA
jgi:dihydroorotate dehydrogenase